MGTSLAIIFSGWKPTEKPHLKLNRPGAPHVFGGRANLNPRIRCPKKLKNWIKFRGPHKANYFRKGGISSLKLR